MMHPPQTPESLPAVRIAVMGVAGRMGQAIVLEALETSTVTVAGGVVRPAHPWSGLDLGACLGRKSLACRVVDSVQDVLETTDVVVDFTHPQSTLELIPLLSASHTALVCGTTGFQAQEFDALKVLSQEVPVVWAANMSLGINVLLSVVAQVRHLLGDGYDLEILDLHHRQKKDAPSGTALALASAGAQARDAHTADPVVLRQRGLIGARQKEEVGIGVLRGGTVAGEHTVFFLGTAERLELTHRAVDRRAFAQGALRAAQWVYSRPAGLYTMRDVLGLNDPQK